MSLIRNRLTGRVLPCCWDDCWTNADDRYRVEVPHDSPRWPGEMLVYTFCGEGHKALWMHSTRDRGNVPTGSKGLLGPLGLPLAG